MSTDNARTVLSNAIVTEAHRLGFDLCRIVPVAEAAHADFFQAWLQAGRAGEMTYLARYQEKRRFPARLAETDAPLRSMIVLAVNYHQFDLPAAVRDDPSRGIVAAYAWGDDYHEIIRPLLYRLDEFIRRRSGRASLGKGLVDTGPVLERDWAQRAGIGFIGKNCCTIHPTLGSWLFLATLLVPEPLVYDSPPRSIDALELSASDVAAGLPPAAQYGVWEIPLRSRSSSSDSTDPPSPEQSSQRGTCGRCTRCLEACPTDAFVGPYHLDPQRCISYWTIESRQPIPRPLRSLFGNRIFGCDICQEVCPWNSRLAESTPLLAGLRAQAGHMAPPLLEGFQPQTPYWLEPEAFNARFRRSPVKRAKRRGMLRNVCVALGNWADPSTVPALMKALNDPEPLGRGHAAWALGRVIGRHGSARAADALATRATQETDAWVAEEIRRARNV